MYMKVVVSLLTVGTAVIAVEMGMLAYRQKAQSTRALTFASDGISMPLDQHPSANDVMLNQVVDHIDIPLMPLERALRQFESQAKVRFMIQRTGPLDSLTREQLQMPVEIHLGDVAVADAVEALLKQVYPPPDYGIRGDFITIGDVGDTEIRLIDVRSLAWPYTGEAFSPDKNNHNDQGLADVIRACVAPNSWRDNGGGGNGAIRNWGGILVVNQTAVHHREIARFLWKLKHQPNPG